MRRKIQLTGALLLMIGALVLSRKLSDMVSGTAIMLDHTVDVVIDAGHGGSDPGKVGINEVKEKDLNLAIAAKVEALLEKRNISCKMTRTGDEGVSGDGEQSKIADMKARVQMINDLKPKLAVSIHQNSYPQEEVKGAQVFYFKHSKGGEAAALLMQTALKTLDESNHREAKANDTYYLLKKTEPPTIIVECGFLTNPEEAEKLAGEEYQNQVAEAIVSGIEVCLGKEEKKN